MRTIHRRLEVRAAADSREIRGVVVSYRDRSPSHSEAFAAGSITVRPRAILDVEHDRMRAVAFAGGGGLEFIDGPDELAFRAELLPIPAADDALARLRSGEFAGASAEFYCLSERDDAGTRIVERADLVGVALTANPSYPMSEVELRRVKSIAAAAVLL